MDSFIKSLERNLGAPLPGRGAQFKMAHVVRKTEYHIPDNVREAGVLALFYPRNSDWHLVFIERVSTNKRDRHSGQISFPGGKHEHEDENLAATAVREAEEEVGVKAEDIKILGELTDLFIPVSNFMVNPFVGFLEYTPQFVPQLTEVQQVLEVPFAHFLKPSTIQKTQLKLSNNMVLNNVPYYNIDGKVLWGATAMMMSELTEVIGRTSSNGI
jgi:8-oxo-dGTP pyrophosphatase MutT (NUDIX family)